MGLSDKDLILMDNLYMEHKNLLRNFRIKVDDCCKKLARQQTKRQHWKHASIEWINEFIL